MREVSRWPSIRSLGHQNSCLLIYDYGCLHSSLPLSWQPCDAHADMLGAIMHEFWAHCPFCHPLCAVGMLPRQAAATVRLGNLDPRTEGLTNPACRDPIGNIFTSDDIGNFSCTAGSTRGRYLTVQLAEWLMFGELEVYGVPTTPTPLSLRKSPAGRNGPAEHTLMSTGHDGADVPIVASCLSRP